MAKLSHSSLASAHISRRQRKQKRTFNSATMSSSVQNTQVTHQDVLLGRGGNINQHPGNVQFRAWVAARKEEYNTATDKVAKALIAAEIVDLVTDQGGRFLQKDGTNWTEVRRSRRIGKTCQALREGGPRIRAAAGIEPSNVPSKKRKMELMDGMNKSIKVDAFKDRLLHPTKKSELVSHHPEPTKSLYEPPTYSDTKLMHGIRKAVHGAVYDSYDPLLELEAVTKLAATPIITPPLSPQPPVRLIESLDDEFLPAAITKKPLVVRAHSLALSDGDEGLGDLASPLSAFFRQTSIGLDALNDSAAL